MSMSARVQQEKRAGARFFGVVFQFLAVLTLIGTFIAAVVVDRVGLEFGIQGSNNFAMWMVIASGLFVTSVLAGFGYTLGLLCAIYDRQETVTPDRETLPESWLTISPIKPPPFKPGTLTRNTETPQSSPANRDSLPGLQVAEEMSPPTPKPPTDRVTLPKLQDAEKPPVPARLEKGAIWEWLTRERRFRRSESD